MTTPLPPRLGHIARPARSPRAVAQFYEDLLGLQIVRQTRNSLIGEAVLLSGRPADEDHELVLLTNPQAEHLAFRVSTREQLTALYGRVKQRGLPTPYAFNSGVALAFFVRDPEGNPVELYFAPGGPHREAPPLSDPDEIDRLILGN